MAATGWGQEEVITSKNLFWNFAMFAFYVLQGAPTLLGLSRLLRSLVFRSFPKLGMRNYEKNGISGWCSAQVCPYCSLN